MYILKFKLHENLTRNKIYDIIYIREYIYMYIKIYILNYIYWENLICVKIGRWHIFPLFPISCSLSLFDIGFLYFYGST